MEKILSYLNPIGAFYDQFKSYFLLTSGILALAFVWHAHTILDEARDDREQAAIIKQRINEESVANAAEKAELQQERENDQNAKKSDDVLDSHIRADAGFNCVIPVVGVRDLQEAVTTYSRARNSH